MTSSLTPIHLITSLGLFTWESDSGASCGLESNGGDENDEDGENVNGGGDELMMMKMKIKVIMGVVDVVQKWGDFMVDWWEDGAIIMSGRVFDHHHGPFFQLDFFSRIGFVHILSDLHKRKPDHHHHFFFSFQFSLPTIKEVVGVGMCVSKCQT